MENKKKSLASTGIQTHDLRLVSSCPGITFHTGFVSLQLISLPSLVASNPGDLSEVLKSTTVHLQPYPEPFCPIELLFSGFTERSGLLGPSFEAMFHFFVRKVFLPSQIHFNFLWLPKIFFLFVKGFFSTFRFNLRLLASHLRHDCVTPACFAERAWL